MQGLHLYHAIGKDTLPRATLLNQQIRQFQKEPRLVKKQPRRGAPRIRQVQKEPRLIKKQPRRGASKLQISLERTRDDKKQPRRGALRIGQV